PFFEEVAADGQVTIQAFSSADETGAPIASTTVDDNDTAFGRSAAISAPAGGPPIRSIRVFTGGLDEGGNPAGRDAILLDHVAFSPQAQPDTTILSGPPAVSRTADATFTFAGSGASGFTCALDGGQATACASPFTAGGLAAGAHRLDVAALD